VDGSRDHIPNVRRPRVAIALGGGGARGIAHVLALEALDEMGIRPVAIAGTSMGAVVGAAYAAGIEGRAIRTHILRVLRNRSDVMGKLLRARVGRFADLVLRGRGNPVLLDPEICLDLFWPSGMPSRFEDLDIETIIVATDYLNRNEIAYDTGPLRPAVAGSMAIPGLFRPVLFGDGVLIDGGAVNPLPYDLFGVDRRNDELRHHLRSCLALRKSCKGRLRLKKSNCARRMSSCGLRWSISQSWISFGRARSCGPPKAARRSSNLCSGSG
jgi:predicted acylesterase/phospholipase RssA